MIKVKVVTVPYNKDGTWSDARDCYVFGEESYVGQLINVFWHPIDGLSGAVLDDYGFIGVHKMDTIEVVAEEK